MHKNFTLLVFVVLISVLSHEKSYAQNFVVRFYPNKIEDKFAINSFPFVSLFKYLDFGYAGCLISFTVTYDKKYIIEEKSNPNIYAEVGLFDFQSKKIEVIRIYDDIDDKFISVYTNTKCNSIMKLSFLKIRCFRGFERQFSHLACPYQFKVEEYFVAMIYGEGSQIEENK